MLLTNRSHTERWKRWSLPQMRSMEQTASGSTARHTAMPTTPRKLTNSPSFACLAASAGPQAKGTDSVDGDSTVQWGMMAVAACCAGSVRRHSAAKSGLSRRPRAMGCALNAGILTTPSGVVGKFRFQEAAALGSSRPRDLQRHHNLQKLALCAPKLRTAWVVVPKSSEPASD